MQKKIRTWIISFGIIIILVLPIIINYCNSNKMEIINYDKYQNLVNSSDFAVVYFGKTDSSNYKSIKETLIDAKYNFDTNIKVVNTNLLTTKQKNKLISTNKNFNTKDVYVFIKDKTIAKVVSGKLGKSKLFEYINYYLNNIIPKSQIAYKTVDTYDAYMEIVNNKKITMSVFGRNTCAWCNKYKPNYNEVATDYNVDIYYFDSDSYNNTEYQKIMNSKELYIPSSCNEKGKDIPLSEGFTTPLTLFTKKGKVIGCISGYVNKGTLINKLSEIKMIK